MNDVIVRGNVLVVTASPKDANGNPIAPGSVHLYLTYTNAAGMVITTDPISMSGDTAGTTWSASFDTSVAKEGPIMGSVRASNPSAAADFIRRLVANTPNPDPT